MSTGLSMVQLNAGAFTPDKLSPLFYTLNVAANETIVTDQTPTSANSLTKSGSNAFITKTGATFTGTDYTRQEITIAGAANAANNGTFLIASVTGTTLLWANAAAVTENPFLGTWSTAGKCSQLLSSDPAHYAFAQATQLNRLVGCDSGFPGHRVLRKPGGTTAWLSIASVSALAGALNGDTTFSFSLYGKLSAFGNGAPEFIRFDDATANNRIGWTPAGPTGAAGSILVRAQGGTTTSNTVAYTFDGSAHLYTCVYTAGGTHEEFIDNVSQGTQSGTVRSPSGMNQVFLSGNSITGDWIVGGWFAKAGALTTAQMLALKSWYAAQLA